MDLAALLGAVRTLPAYRSLLTDLSERVAPDAPLRLIRAARPAIAAALAEDLPRPVVLLVSRHDRLLTLAEEMPAWAPGLHLLPFPDPRPLFYERAAWGPRTIGQRISALAALTAAQQPLTPAGAETPGPTLIMASARSVIARTLSPRDFLANSRWLSVGATARLERLLTTLVGAGYQPVNLVTQPGQFSRRGGILDLWPPAETWPVRLEFFGDDIDSMRHFDPASQRSGGETGSIRVTPAREGLPRLYHDSWDALLPETGGASAPPREPYLEFFLPWMNRASAGLFDFLPPQALLLFEDRPAFLEAVSEQEEMGLALREEQTKAGALPADMPIPYLTLPEVEEAIAGRGLLDLGRGQEAYEGEGGLAPAFLPGPRFGGQLRPLMEHIRQRRARHETVVVVSRQSPRLAELWSEADSLEPVRQALPEVLQPGEVHFVQGALSEGWELRREPDLAIHLLSDAEVFGWGRPRPRPAPRPAAAAPESAYADLRPGDWVVHAEYGIGRFAGLVERTLDELPREFLLIEYAEGDQLYVPVHQADQITRYVGVDDAAPAPSRLGTQEWERSKGRAREAAEAVARDLLDLYARRMAAEGHAFSADTGWQSELEASFPYIETEDQLHAIDAVKADMERRRPMDRLICGDVGYGKTEVALRAAFKAVMDGKQVGILVPTTVLAQQHFDTFRQRLAAFPVEVEMLSRFRTRAEAEAIVERVSRGEVDILIGTHRLLQQDVTFKDLGLVIIDEEQRFGVTHKEYLKRLRTEVDVLTLTATPIPRTLYLAISGVRDISTINTPPEERLPIITHVGPYDPRLVRQAVLREIERNGQVFFVHNRIQTIDGMRARLENLVPEARLAVAHGQVPERQLSEVMERFNAGEIDVLLSTSIIESGLDIPNANTLIVDRADTFGLAQLYQLRGRVGRGAARAFAYFFRHPRFRAAEEAAQRLEIIAEQTQLGAGYTIAMRDLEMRGAGEILGTRQHGHIAAVGFHLYIRLLSQAVRRLRGDRAAPPTLPQMVDVLPVSVDLPLPSTIPASYIPDRDLRLQLYRRMAEIRSTAELERLAAEFIDRFGALPEEVTNLLFQLEVKLLAAQAGVEAISAENGQLLLSLSPVDDADELPDLGPGVRRSKRGYWLARGAQPDWRERLTAALRALGGAHTGPPTLAPDQLLERNQQR